MSSNTIGVRGGAVTLSGVRCGPLGVVFDDWPSPVAHAGYTWTNVAALLDYVNADWENNAAYVESLRHITYVVVGHALVFHRLMRDALATTGYANLKYTDFDNLWSKHSNVYSDALESFRRDPALYEVQLHTCRRLRNAFTSIIWNVDIFKVLAAALMHTDGGTVKPTTPSVGYKSDTVPRKADNVWVYTEDLQAIKYKHFDIRKVDEFISFGGTVDMSQYRSTEDDRPIQMQRMYSTANELLADVLYGDGVDLGNTVSETTNRRRHRAMIESLLKVDRAQRDSANSLLKYVPINSHIHSVGDPSYNDEVTRFTDEIIKKYSGIPPSLHRYTFGCWPRTDKELRHLTEYCRFAKAISRSPPTLTIDDDSILYPLQYIPRFNIDNVNYASVAHAIALISVVYHMKVSDPQTTIRRYAIDVNILPAISDTIQKSRGVVWSEQSQQLVAAAATTKFKVNPWMFAELAMLMRRYDLDYYNGNMYSDLYATGNLFTLKRSLVLHFGANPAYTIMNTFASPAESPRFSVPNSPLSRHVILCVMSYIFVVARTLFGDVVQKRPDAEECFKIVTSQLLYKDFTLLEQSSVMDVTASEDLVAHRESFKALHGDPRLSDDVLDAVYACAASVIASHNSNEATFVECCYAYALKRARDDNSLSSDSVAMEKCLLSITRNLCKIGVVPNVTDVDLLRAATVVLTLDECACMSPYNSKRRDRSLVVLTLQHELRKSCGISDDINMQHLHDQVKALINEDGHSVVTQRNINSWI
ncbi:hypothetical protein F8203_gp028 [Heliothis virescens ascovirus 3f]|uniref:Uncharacterized protein n=1 Tax=Heliothis virescens ascovirus 3f TaxID=328614 RepID=A0A171PVB0_9VIRU|nr:hypothetical protein F8203_gp028 [Heliothis virescens ascovirus 3f]AJP08994.1 hypothetical protein [Heliothis virescens ascovirus 3f]